MTSILDKPLSICSTNPLTGYARDGYCKNREDDQGTHVICAKVTDDFLQFTKMKGNDLITPSASFPGLKEGDKWCLCALRWDEARKEGKAPPIDLEATDKSALKFNPLSTYLDYTLTRKTKGGKKNKTRKHFLYHPEDPKRSFDVYINKNPKNTIPIKYTTIDDVKNTIQKLERYYKQKKYTHKRIWQVAMILKVRLGVLKDKKPEQYKLAQKYLLFLSQRTKMNEKERFHMEFKL